ncbi:MAG: hypothetical protein V1745_02100 [Patescibacteria group bacterium]
MKKPALTKRTKMLLWILGAVLIVGTVAIAATICIRQRSDFERRLQAVERSGYPPNDTFVVGPKTNDANEKSDASSELIDENWLFALDRNNLSLTNALRTLVRTQGIKLPWNENSDHAHLGLRFSYPPLPFYQYRPYADQNISLDVSYDEGSFTLYTETFYTATTTENNCGPLLEPVVERVTINGYEFCRSESNGGGMSTDQELIQYSAVSPNGILRSTFEFWGIPHDRYCEEDGSCNKKTSDSKAFHAFVDSIMKTVRFEPTAIP